MMTIFDHLSFLGKLLKELRQKHLKITTEFGHQNFLKIFCVRINGFDVPDVCKYRFVSQERHKTLFQKIFCKKSQKKIFDFPF